MTYTEPTVTQSYASARNQVNPFPSRRLMTEEQYLSLLDWTGRQIRDDKRGSIPAQLAPILDRLGLNAKLPEVVGGFAKRFHSAVGRVDSLGQFALRLGRRWIAGERQSRYSVHAVAADRAFSSLALQHESDSVGRVVSGMVRARVTPTRNWLAEPPHDSILALDYRSCRQMGCVLSVFVLSVFVCLVCLFRLSFWAEP